MSSARSTEITREEAAADFRRGIRKVRLVRFLIGLASLVLMIVTGSLTGALTVELILGGVAILATVYSVYRVIAVLLAPTAPGGEMAPATGWRRRELEREKYWLLKAIKEVEFDHEMGKVNDHDFAEISASYRLRAVRLMRELDAKEPDYRQVIEKEVGERLARMGAEPARAPAEPAPEPATPAPPEPARAQAAASEPATSEPTAAAEPAAALAEAAAQPSEPPDGAPVEPAEPIAAVGGAVFSDALSKLCAKCATRNDDDAEFCKKCGTKVAA